MRRRAPAAAQRATRAAPACGLRTGATVPRRPPRGAPKRPRPVAARSSSVRGRRRRPPAPGRRAPSGRWDRDASRQSVAVTWSSASTAGPPPTGWMRTPTTCRPAEYIVEGARSWSRPPSSRRGAAPSSVHVTDGDAGAVGPVRDSGPRRRRTGGCARSGRRRGRGRERSSPGATCTGSSIARPRREDGRARGASGAGAAEPPAGSTTGQREQRGEQGDRQAAGLHGA